jgi:phage shock protein PspC (stress-responsive transcriptional regulator)
MNDYASQPTDQVPSGEQPADAPAQDQPSSFGYQPRPSGYESLYRPEEGRMIAGVAAGIARYLGVDVTIVRIALALLTVIGGAGIPVYVAGWLLMPDEASDQSIASELIGSLQSRPN